MSGFWGDLEVPAGGFRAVIADPPWTFNSWAPPRHSGRRDVEIHYKTIGIADLMAMPVKEVIASDAHLFLWVTGPKLPHAFKLIEAWGFRYSGIGFTWIKLRRSHNPNQLRVLPTADADLHVGLGFTTRKNAEFCLLARRGSAKRLSRKVREVILAPVREHSRKPDEIYPRIEEYCAGPYLELFARQRRPGWSSWGNETDKFREAA